MKKSEMIKIIKEVLARERSTMIGAEKILDAIEKAGMLPPFTYLKNIGTLDTAWEPEDEE